MKITHSSLGTFAILLATLFWGMTFAFIKDAVSVISPFTFLFWRFAIASILLLIAFYKKFSFDQKTVLYGLGLGIFLSGTVIFQTIGLRYTTASTASFITGLSVIIVAIIESFFNRRWPSRYIVLSSFLAIIGVSLITLSNGLVINQGDIWVLLCAFCFAGYIIFAGKASLLHQPITLTFIQSSFICLLAGAISFFIGELEIPDLEQTWIAILYCSLFASIIAFLLQLQYQKYVNASKAAIIFSLEPVFATITAAIYLGEAITFQFIIGAALIFLAILLSEKKVKQKVIPQE